MKPTKKKTAKKRNPMVGKLLDLKYRINEAYQNTLAHSVDSESTKTDKSWVMQMIDNVRNGKALSKEEMLVSNNLWRKYE